MNQLLFSDRHDHGSGTGIGFSAGAARLLMGGEGDEQLKLFSFSSGEGLLGELGGQLDNR